jgi:hypothetical protein
VASLWSKIKKALKKVWRAAKAVVRVVVRSVIATVNNSTLGLFDSVLGFLLWPRKRLRLHVVILSEKGIDPDGGEVMVPVVPVQEVQDVVDKTKRIYKELFNVDVRPYSKTFIEVLSDEAPAEVLDYDCSFGSEFGVAGEYIAKHLAGWNAIPISLTFPVTAFVVRSVKGSPAGCSMWFVGEYVVIDHEGLTQFDNIPLPHEIGHTCTLWHSGTPTNLMHDGPAAGEHAKWFQKNLLRSSRHVQYW